MIRRFAVRVCVVSFGAAVLLGAGPGFVPIQPASAAACVTIPAVAHRGGTERYAENTREAFRDAANRGVRLWETDVQFTADNVPVLMHDETLDRTTDLTGPVSEVTGAQVVAARTDDGHQVPTLDELLNDAEVDGARVFVELKTAPTSAQWAQVAAAISAHAMARNVLITSFDQQALTDAHTMLPGVATGLIGILGDVPTAEVTPYGTALFKHHDSITASRLGAWTPPLKTYAWTADTQAVWERMSWYPSLAGVITNRPGAYLAWQRSRVC